MALTDNTTKINQLLEAINNLPAAGAGDPVIQSLNITPSESEQEFKASSVDGYKPVTVEAISKTYVGSEVPRKSAEVFRPGTEHQSIYAGQYLTETQYILGDTNLKPENIKKDVTIFDVLGTFEGESSGGSGGGLPEGVSKLVTGVYTPATDYSVDYTITHNFGEIPNFAVLMMCNDLSTTPLKSEKIMQVQFNKKLSTGSGFQNTRGAYLYYGSSGSSISTGGITDATGDKTTTTTLKFAGHSSYPLKAGYTYRWVVAVVDDVIIGGW